VGILVVGHLVTESPCNLESSCHKVVLWLGFLKSH